MNIYGDLTRLVTAICAICLFAFSTSAVRNERIIETWRPVHYSVDIKLDDGLKHITARTEIAVVAVKKLSVIDLDFGELTTDWVTVDSRAVPFEHRNGKLNIKLPVTVNEGTKLTVTVSYRGSPKDGLILTNDKDGRPSAVGDNWPDRVHNWIPCLDHPSAKATVTFNVTAPAHDAVVANGKIIDIKSSAAGTRTWTYSEANPIPPYCMIIGVGDFAVLRSAVDAVTPLAYYVPPSDEQFAQAGFAPAAAALHLFVQTVGPYPYEKLALIVGATRFGGMENSSAIVFTSMLFNPNPTAGLSSSFGIPAGTVDIVAHEIAHQWFGDSVTESTWADLWLSEGFATYFSALFIQKHDGEAAFQSYMKQAAETAFAYEKQNPIPIFDRQTEDLFKLLNANNYQKGAWVLHMLRSQLGDEAFFRGIKSYYKAHKGSNANSDDLRAALEQASEKDLKRFFNRWVYDSGHPRYELSVRWDKGMATLTLRQVQSGKAFLDPIPILIITPDGKREVTISPTGQTTTQTLKLDQKPISVELDPQNTLLKEVNVRY